MVQHFRHHQGENEMRQRLQKQNYQKISKIREIGGFKKIMKKTFELSRFGMVNKKCDDQKIDKKF